MATTRPKAIEIDDVMLSHIIEQDPNEPGRHNARFVEYGHHVSAVIGTLQRNNWDIALTADEWHMPEIAIQAAIEYYARHRELFDAYFLLQHEEYEADQQR